MAIQRFKDTSSPGHGSRRYNGRFHLHLFSLLPIPRRTSGMSSRETHSRIQHRQSRAGSHQIANVEIKKMSIEKLTRSILGTVSLLFLAAAIIAPTAVFGDHDNKKRFKRYLDDGFDVAEIGSRFVPDDAPFKDGLPAYGNSFITQGYIYPPGTLEPCDNVVTVCEGVNPDGSAQWPDKVIGRWSCFGWHVADAATATSGASVVTTQIYEFSEMPGRVTFVSDGFELVFGDSTPIFRAVTGGTGPLSKVVGEVSQSYLGFPNTGGGVNLQFRTHLKGF